MIKILIILLLFINILIGGCSNKKSQKIILTEAEKAINTNPDSIFILLESKKDIMKQHTEDFAFWCMLNAKVRDMLGKTMPDIADLKQAVAYYKEKKNPVDQSRIKLFLGRSYFEQKEYEEAMSYYLQALDDANKAKDYNQLGFIYTYMADIYHIKAQYSEARKKYEKAVYYFSLAPNNKSKAIALSNLGYAYTLESNPQKALAYYKQSDSLVIQMQDSITASILFNRMGITYTELKEYALAENYLLKAINYSPKNNAPNHLALSNIYLLQNNIDMARLSLTKWYQDNNIDVRIGCIYQSYLIEKKNNNFQLALNYNEQYHDYLDSINQQHINENIIEIEKKYEYSKVINENYELKTYKQYNINMSCFSIILYLLLFSIYPLTLKYKNKKIILQQKELDNNKIIIQNKNIELQKEKIAFHKIEKKLKQNNQDLLRHELKLKNNESATEQEQKINRQEIYKLKEQILKIRKKKLLESTIGKKNSKIIVKASIHDTSFRQRPKKFTKRN